MKNSFCFLVCLILAFLSSCIPNKDLVYLQNKNAADATVDSIIKMQKSYKVQINDMLSVRVRASDAALVEMFNPVEKDDKASSGSEERLYFDGFLVDNHGEINVPTLGKVNVLNLTTEEIKNKIETKLMTEYFKKEAYVFVTVKLGGIKYTTFGEVRKPGTSIVYRERANIFEIIANSGDITDVGNRKDVILLRPYPGGYETHHLDLTNNAILNSQYFYIQPNDMVYVKPLKQKSWGTGKTGVESFTTVITVFSALATTYLLFKTL